MFAVVGCFFRWGYVDVREVTFWACDGLGGWGGYSGYRCWISLLFNLSAREADRREGVGMLSPQDALLTWNRAPCDA